MSVRAMQSATPHLRRQPQFAITFAGPAVQPTKEREAMHRVLDEVPDLAEEDTGPIVGTEHCL